MPGDHGVRAGYRGVMLTASAEEDAVIEAVAAGATGYLQKVPGMDRLLDTVQEVGAGELRVLAEVVPRVFAGIRRGVEEEQGPGDLTPRQREILALFCRGPSYARIAEARGMKPVTIGNAVYAIQGKLGFRSKQEMVVWAVRNGLLDD